jgi:hypothetical protein
VLHLSYEHSYLFHVVFSIGDDYPSPERVPNGGGPGVGINGKDSLLPGVTTRELAEQTNQTLQAAVRRDGQAYVSYLDGLIVALREELDAPSVVGEAFSSTTPNDGDMKPGTAGLTAPRYPPPVERTPYRIDVKQDGTGIESPGWFSSSVDVVNDSKGLSTSTVMSRLCALDWVIVLYESVVPILLKADVSCACRLR